MDAVPGLRALQSRKRALLLESEVNRQLLELEVMQLRLSFERLRSGWMSPRGVWKWVATVTGFIMARRLSRNPGFMAKGPVLVSLLGAAWKIWSALKRPARAEGGESS